MHQRGLNEKLDNSKVMVCEVTGDKNQLKYVSEFKYLKFILNASSADGVGG